jgi:2-keto-4-pentenoate hydratase
MPVDIVPGETVDVRTEAADRLRHASVTLTPCNPVRDLLGRTDLAAGYQVQAANLAVRYAAGRRRVGRKIGLTSPAVQKQLGVDRPDFGSLLDDMAVPAGEVVPPHQLIQPKVEAEVAFWLRADLDGPLESVDEVRAAVASACAAIEIVDSRITGWDICITDTIADNASSGLYVLSKRVFSLEEMEPVEVDMTLEINGVQVSSGNGAACLGDPLLALLWLARTAKALGEPLRAGEVVLSGALGPMVAVAAGDHVVAKISGLGSVETRFSSEEKFHG